VLSVDYRLSVGYGQAFQFAESTGARGAAEYRDILAAGRYLQTRANVDPGHIGVWGASYGGYLSALALGRNSDVFAAGVDIHGVHDRLPAVNAMQQARAIAGDTISEADLRQALKVAFESSPSPRSRREITSPAHPRRRRQHGGFSPDRGPRTAAASESREGRDAGTAR
jgi:dienelactone hydrolase